MRINFNFSWQNRVDKQNYILAEDVNDLAAGIFETQDAINDIDADLKSQIEAAQSNLEEETAARETTDNELRQSIIGEKTARETSEKNIQRQIQNVELLLEDKTAGLEEEDEIILGQVVEQQEALNEHVTNQVLDHPDKSVTSEKIADEGVQNRNIAEEAITSGKIYPGAVGTEALAEGAVTSSIIADDAITPRTVADGAIIYGKIANDAVTGDNIEPESIVEDHLIPELQDKITGYVRKINLTEYYHYDEDVHQLRCDGFPSTGLYVVYADVVPDNANNILLVNDEVGYQLSKDIEEGNTYLFVVTDDVVTGVDSEFGHIDVYSWDIDIDTALSETSKNPVQNKVIAKALKEINYADLASAPPRPNLLLDSGTPKTGTAYPITAPLFGYIKPKAGDTVTLSINATLPATATGIGIYNSSDLGAYGYQFNNVSEGTHTYIQTVTWKEPPKGTTNLKVFVFPRNTNATINWVKCEMGEGATDWVPGLEDYLATKSALEALEERVAALEG